MKASSYSVLLSCSGMGTINPTCCEFCCGKQINDPVDCYPEATKIPHIAPDIPNTAVHTLLNYLAIVA